MAVLTDKFRKFILEVSHLLNEDDRIFSYINEKHEIVVEMKKDTVCLTPDVLHEYYKLYLWGKKTFEGAKIRAAALIKKNILRLE